MRKMRVCETNEGDEGKRERKFIKNVLEMHMTG
jgi:hypothetical protein